MRVGLYIPNRNHGHVISKILGAAVLQGVDEILVVDDASSDDSREVISQYPVRLVCHAEKSADHCEALAPFVSEMDADYLVGAGADDLIYDGFVDSIRAAAERFSPGVVFCDYAIVDHLGNTLGVRGGGFKEVTYLSPAEASARLVKSGVGLFECGVGAAVHKSSNEWLRKCGAWRMGPWIDSIGNSVAASVFGAVYVPQVLAAFTVQPSAGNWHAKVHADHTLAGRYRANIMEFFCHPDVASSVPADLLSAIAIRWGA